MTRFEVALPRHAALVARSMRARDVAEIVAGWSLPPEDAILASLRESYYARICFYGMEPLAIYGLAPLCVLARTARVWIFGTRYIDDHKFAFCRASKVAVRCLAIHASVITNLIDAEDEPAQRWLKWLGGDYVGQHQRGGRQWQQFVVAPCQRA